MVDANELLQAERLLREINDDPFHPANDKSHPEYLRTNQAYRLLKSKAALARAELEAQRYFRMKK